MKPYSYELYHACLDFFLHKNQDFMSSDYHARYVNLLILVFKIHGTLNERLCQEYRDAEDRAKDIKNSPVYKIME